jgi:hypothetical protein
MRNALHARVPVVVALAAAIGLCIAGPAQAAPSTSASAQSAVEPDSVGIRLLDIPVDEAGDPRARQYIVDNLSPGTVIHRRVEVANQTAGPLQVSLYPDAATIANGAFTGADGAAANALTSWTTLSQGSLSIPANSTAPDTVTIDIPADAAPGEQYGIVWAQVGGPANGNVTLVNRTGIRMYLSVGGANPPASSFTVDTVTAQRNAAGQPTVLAQVHNTGGRALDMSGTVSLAKVSGSLKAGPYAVQLGTTLAPGQSEPVLAAIADQLDNGPWDATIELQSGTIHESFTARITFPDGPGTSPAAAAHPAHGAGHRVLIIIVAIVAVLIAVGALGLLLYVLRRRRRSAGSETASAGTRDR